jgi:hypothetical protein
MSTSSVSNFEKIFSCFIEGGALFFTVCNSQFSTLHNSEHNCSRTPSERRR